MKTSPIRSLLIDCVIALASAFLCTVNVAAQTDDSSPIERLLTEARDYLATGHFDLADKRYRQMLALDPDNEAASLGRPGLKDARARFEKAMAESRPTPAPGRSPTPDTVASQRKLQSIVIPYFEIHDMTLNDAVERLRKEARIYDTDPDANERGVNILLKLNSGNLRNAAPTAKADAGIPVLPPGVDTSAPATLNPIPTGKTLISLTLSRIPLCAALDYVAKAANLKIKVEPYAVSIVPLSESTEELFTAEVRVPPSFIAADEGTTKSQGTGTVEGRIDAKTILESNGVTFPPGSAAVYLRSTSKLIIRNTRANLDLVEVLLGPDFTSLTPDTANPSPTPVQ